MEKVTHHQAQGEDAGAEGEISSKILCCALAAALMGAGWLASRVRPISAWADVLYLMAYLPGGFFGLRASVQELRRARVEVDFLMVLAALAAAVVGAPLEGAILLFLFSLSDVLQTFATNRMRKAVRSLTKLRPTSALVRRGGQVRPVSVKELLVGDTVLVRPGESIPADGVITEGTSAIDESSLSGESMPVLKERGSKVFAATVNQTGGLELRVTRAAEESAVENLIRMVEKAQNEKARSQSFLERAEQVYATGVIVATAGLIVIPLLVGHESLRAILYRAATLMVVASPCALVIGVPAAILSAIGGAARRGVLFKGGASLEQAAAVKIVALDKTGTLTTGKPRVTELVDAAGRVLPPDEAKSDPGALELLRLAASLEVRSEHPIARAIVAELESHGHQVLDCTDFQSLTGRGVSGTVAGRRLVLGNERKLAPGLRSAGETPVSRSCQALADKGKTCVVIMEVSAEGSPHALGAIAVADTLRPEAIDFVKELRALGLRRIVMLTGDGQRVAAAIAQQAGIDEFEAELMPEQKLDAIGRLQREAPVMMIGDGINDAPALATADVGVAMGAAGTDVAMETADIVLMGESLRGISHALALSRQARRVVWQNLSFAAAVILVLAAATLGWSLPLPAGVVGHEGSTVLVCLNGLRLLAFRGVPSRTAAAVAKG